MTKESIFEERLTAVRAKFEGWGVKGVLIGSEGNRRWLSGFTGSAGQLLITAEKALLATDFRYWEQARHQAPDFTLFKSKRTDEDNQKFIAEAGVDKIGLESQHVTLSERAKLDKIASVDWVQLPDTAESLRKNKSKEELNAIRAAAAITDQTMKQVNEIARPGLTERELAWELEKAMREAGADGVAFEVIVASGPNAAFPHHHPGERRLQEGDSIIVDMGAKVDGYHSDLTRTFYMGAKPDERFSEIYKLVEAAQLEVLNNIKPGMTGKDVDSLARNLIADAGHGDHFGHGLGHGVGLFIHEGPHLSPRSEKETVEAGMVLTVEPGIYIPGWGGARLEDLILITDEGFEHISHCPKIPLIRF